MVRYCAALIGLCCFGSGLVLVFYGSEVPEKIRLDDDETAVLILCGLLCMYYGRHYLLAWIGTGFSESDNTDD